MKNAFLLLGVAAVLLMCGLAVAEPLTVVALFTSRGCSSRTEASTPNPSAAPHRMIPVAAARQAPMD